jgi:hypothetical protein
VNAGSRIAIIVEGETETAFKQPLRKFLESRLAGRMPKLGFRQERGRVPKGDALKKLVANLLRGHNAFDHVIALTDVYTGSNDFTDAADAKAKMRRWVGQERRFHAHAAQFEFEAWLVPYWTTIQRLAGNRNAKMPAGHPEKLNHSNPPSKRLRELFRRGASSRPYSKPREALHILRENDLLVSARICTELRSFLNTILRLSGGEEIS